MSFEYVFATQFPNLVNKLLHSWIDRRQSSHLRAHEFEETHRRRYEKSTMQNPTTIKKQITNLYSRKNKCENEIFIRNNEFA